MEENPQPEKADEPELADEADDAEKAAVSMTPLQLVSTVEKGDENTLAEIADEEVMKKKTTLLEIAESKTKLKEARQLKRQTTAKIVDKRLKDHFRGWSSIDIDGSVVGDLTLRETLMRDKRRAREDPQFVMGAYYYQSLQNKNMVRVPKLHVC